MKDLPIDEKILFFAAGILLLSIVLMIVIIPGIITDTYPKAFPKGAVIGVSLAILIRLIIFSGYVKIIRDIRRSQKKRKGFYITIGILLIFFALIYIDGAFAFLNHKNILYVSILMFTSVLCELVASTLTFVALFLKPKK